MYHNGWMETICYIVGWWKMKYYEITKDSPAHKICEMVWNMQGDWGKACGDIKELIGCETNDNLILRPERLVLKNVPSDIKSQFCTVPWTGGYYPAKVNSQINKDFIKISEKHRLYCATALDIAIELGTAWTKGHELYHYMDGKHYIETARKIEKLVGLEEIAAPDFLRLRASWLESKK